MAGFSNATELAILDAVGGGSAFGPGGTLYLALVTVAVGESDTGSSITEAGYTSYARKSFTSSDWNAASAGAKTNLNALAFAQATGGSATVIGFAIVTASSAGTILMFGTLTSASISTGITPQFDVASLTLNLD